MDVFLTLASHGTNTVSRERIIASVWSGVHVVDGVLPRAIYQLRRALGSEAHLVETVRGRGYRLTAPIRPIGRAAHPQKPGIRFPALAGGAAALMVAGLLAWLALPLTAQTSRANGDALAHVEVTPPAEAASAGQDLVPVMSLAEERQRNIAANREALRREREAVTPSWEGHLTHAGTPQPDPAPAAPEPKPGAL